MFHRSFRFEGRGIFSPIGTDLISVALVYASPFWKRDKSGQPKYFYLLHTQRKGEPRNREYIGCDANRIARANAAIERAKQYDDLNQRLTRLQSQAEQGVRVLADAKRILTGNVRPW
ncbi:hypothetical protein [Xanthomonas cassavae]|nr:hypothetical protein [Xanthomonas cassavae]